MPSGNFAGRLCDATKQPESGGVQGRLRRLPLRRLFQPAVNVFTGLLGDGHDFPEVIEIKPLCNATVLASPCTNARTSRCKTDGFRPAHCMPDEVLADTSSILKTLSAFAPSDSAAFWGSESFFFLASMFKKGKETKHLPFATS